MKVDLILDERIRDYVFLPLLYILFIMGIIKMSVQKLMGRGAQPEIKITETEKIADNNEKLFLVNFRMLVLKARKLRSLNGLLPIDSFSRRKNYLSSPQIGSFK